MSLATIVRYTLGAATTLATLAWLLFYDLTLVSLIGSVAIFAVGACGTEAVWRHLASEDEQREDMLARTLDQYDD